jgi:hypothetical protein
VVYRRGGRTVRARIAGPRDIGTRLRLPLREQAARLPPGRRVTLRVRLRAAAAGCGFGPARTLSLRTQVVWIPTKEGHR